MHRVASAIATWVVTSAVVLGAVRWVAGDAVAAVTRERYAHRAKLEAVLSTSPDRRPLIVWMGDSTLEIPAAATLPHLVERRLALRGPVDVRAVDGPGFDFYAHYFVLERVLALRPDLIVMTANLRLLVPNPDAPGWYNDLASALPPRELPRAARLPLAPARLSAARLALLQCLRASVCETLGLDLDAFRIWATGAWVRVAGPILGPEPAIALPKPRDVLRKFYDITLSADSALVEVLAATVGRAEAAGVPTVVYFAPMPLDLLAAAGLDDPGRWRRNAGVLRAATESAGGTFVDLHDALGAREVDAMAHYDATGARRLAERLTDVFVGVAAQGAAHGP